MHKLVFSTVLIVACVSCAKAGDLGMGAPLGTMVAGVAEPGGHWHSDLNICSKLDMSHLTWPGNLTLQEQSVFALALNISGSFEGSDGWRNITNNFDGEGLSLGLLNQCLGEGSLQPLMIRMIDVHSDLMKQYFVGTNFDTLNQMLTEWKKHHFSEQGEEETIDGFSSLDDEDVVNEFLAQVSAEKRKPKPKKPKPKPKPKTSNDVSVDWAVKHIYTDSKGLIFKPQWIEGLTMMSDSGEYRSLQLAKAFSLYQGAMALFHHFKTTQVRSFLFFFDLMVQNGGINSDVIDSIDAILKKKPHSETQKLRAILNYRLKFVRKKYVKDVRSRKESLINGGGFVHGLARDYDLEYCTSLNSLLYPDASEVENFLNF